MRRTALPLLLMAAAALTGCSLTSSSPDNQPTVDPVAVAVAVTQAAHGRVTAASTASGQLEPLLSVPITAKVGGRVVAVHKEMGDTVTAGELLVELEARDYAAQLAQAQAQLSQAVAQRNEAERQRARLAELLKEGAISQQQYEQVQTQVTLAQAQVSAASAQVDLASAQFERTRVTAPADGVLAARATEVGALVGIGTPVFELVDLSTMNVWAGVAEADINRVQVGTEVPVIVSALGREVKGTVAAVSPAMDRQTRSYMVKVTVPNPDGSLKGGMYAQVRFPTVAQEGIVIPVGSVVERDGETFVYIIEGDVATLTKVQLLTVADDAAVVEGVSAGARVVVQGQNRLYDGAPVRLGKGS